MQRPLEFLNLALSQNPFRVDGSSFLFLSLIFRRKFGKKVPPSYTVLVCELQTLLVHDKIKCSPKKLSWIYSKNFIFTYVPLYFISISNQLLLVTNLDDELNVNCFFFLQIWFRDQSNYLPL